MVRQPPDALLRGRRVLDGLAGVEVLTDWEVGWSDRWHLHLRLNLPELGNAELRQTDWYVRVDDQYPAGRLNVHPSAQGGIRGTWPHQTISRPTDDGPWLSGSLCLAPMPSRRGLRPSEVEDPSAEGRLSWYVERAKEWLGEASAGRLQGPGDRFELPFYIEDFGITSNGRLAYREGPETFVRWSALPDRFGLADMRIVKDDPGLLWVPLQFRTLGEETLVAPAWGFLVTNAKRGPLAVWVRFDKPFVMPPWGPPETWGEMREVARAQDVDLDSLFQTLLEPIRNQEQHLLLIGYPIPAIVGEPSQRMHWQALRLGSLQSRFRPANGFRDTPVGRIRADRANALSNARKVGWIWSENWHPTQLASRGQFQQGLAGRAVMLIGAGALGSMIGELLVRGGVTDIVLFDHDTVVPGNLARHTLTVEEVGLWKAPALAERLNAISASAKVTPYGRNFADVAAHEDLQRYELIVDTTGNDSVLEALGATGRPATTLFASVSIAFGAERVYCFLAAGDRFPLEVFNDAMAPWMEANAADEREMEWEGVGCWNAVFPARADDIWLLSSAAVRAMEDAFPLETGSSALLVFAPQKVGGVFSGVLLVDKPTA